jgi:Ca2+/Na+ antiporter
MTLADVLVWFLLVAGTFLALLGAWLAAHALWPAAVERCSGQYSRPVRATLVGLVTSLPIFAIGAAAADRGKQVPALGVVGVALLLLLLVSAVFGLAGLARRIGAGLPSPLDEAQPWLVSLRGGLVLAATFLLPFGGWFVLLPCALVSGFGALVMAWRQRGRA